MARRENLANSANRNLGPESIILEFSSNGNGLVDQRKQRRAAEVFEGAVWPAFSYLVNDFTPRRSPVTEHHLRRLIRAFNTMHECGCTIKLPQEVEICSPTGKTISLTEEEGGTQSCFSVWSPFRSDTQRTYSFKTPTKEIFFRN